MLITLACHVEAMQNADGWASLAGTHHASSSSCTAIAALLLHGWLASCSRAVPCDGGGERPPAAIGNKRRTDTQAPGHLLDR